MEKQANKKTKNTTHTHKASKKENLKIIILQEVCLSSSLSYANVSMIFVEPFIEHYAILRKFFLCRWKKYIENSQTINFQTSCHDIDLNLQK